MLPTAHVEFTWATLNLLQRRLGWFPDADYRWMAACAVLPDAIDKPLATFVFTDSNAALLFGHTALLHGSVWAAAWAGGHLPRALPYLLAFSGHLVADRMWGFAQTLLWPLRGWRFHQWKHVGSPEAIVQAYLKIVREEPKLVAFEVIGAGLLAWFVVDRQLWRPERLWTLLRTGRVDGRPCG
ncbi:MAG: metal-dependent hydrolase [Caldilineales bacterium]|nr:metal-dependent hydrolase [Caldilineales bacterium]MDW8318427.1 hypothetical protein [Anaerolineae bacterium]